MIKKNGVVTFKGFSDAEKKEIEALYASGASQTDIANHMKVGLAKIQRFFASKRNTNAVAESHLVRLENRYFGKKFGELTPVKFSGRNNQGVYLLQCNCSCGKETLVSTSELTSLRVISCG